MFSAGLIIHLARLLDDEGSQPLVPVRIELVHELFLSGGTFVRTNSALVGAGVPQGSRWHGRVGERRHDVGREWPRVGVGHAVALAGHRHRRLLQGESLGHRW